MADLTGDHIGPTLAVPRLCPVLTRHSIPHADVRDLQRRWTVTHIKNPWCFVDPLLKR